MLNGVQPSPNTFADIVQLTSHADLAFGNLEIPLTNSRTRTLRKSAAELQRKDQFILKADPRHARFLSGSGIGAVSLANNHAMDYGFAGLSEMTALLDHYKIAHAGAGPNATSAMKAAIVSVRGGKKIALLSVMAFQSTAALRKTTPATLTSPGVGVLNLSGTVDTKARNKLARWIKSARQNADFVVVGIHWGIERKNLPTPYQVSLGRALVDAGADVVWGNHPHVLQGAEMYKGNLIMYSMGNLVSSLPSQNGFFKLTIQEDGTQKPEFSPAQVRGGRVLMLRAKQKAAAFATMKGLCRLLLARYPSSVSLPAL